MESKAKAPEKEFRNYDSGDLVAVIKDHYRKMRTRQTVDYVHCMQGKYLTFDKPLTIRQAMESLNRFVDLSDPDLTLPNVQHLIQAAEGARAAGKPDWMQLVGLIHDLGKVMFLWGSDEDGTSLTEQWGLVGDIFLLGCALPDTTVYPEFNSLNQDQQNPKYTSERGIYAPNCGIDACIKAWGHDEYLFQVLRKHPHNRLPEAAMVMIRYHSFYPWHTGGSYSQFADAKDAQYKAWVKEFNQFDLYTKAPKTYDLNEVMEYYQPIIDKYLGTEPILF